MGRTSQGVDLKAIADMAGVSISTVSRVLNDVQPVSDEMRDKVLAVAARVNYEKPRPRSHAANRTVFVLTSDDLNPYFHEIIHGATEEAAKHELFLAHVTLPRPGAQSEILNKLLRRQSQLAAVIVFAGILPPAEINGFQRSLKKPVVVMDESLEPGDVPAIKIDYVKAAEQAAQHLVALNHKRFAYLSGPHDSPVSALKLEGVQKALRAVGLEIPQAAVLEGSPSVDWGFQAMTQVLSQPAGRRPTAVVCSCDLVAFGALHAVRSAGLTVPRDVSVLGFDDISMAAHANPPLTTVAIPKDRMGRLAVDLIRQMLAGRRPRLEAYVMLESPLIVRDSTGPAPNSGS